MLMFKGSKLTSKIKYYTVAGFPRLNYHLQVCYSIVIW
jgi:hypothetical protein